MKSDKAASGEDQIKRHEERSVQSFAKRCQKQGREVRPNRSLAGDDDVDPMKVDAEFLQHESDLRIASLESRDIGVGDGASSSSSALPAAADAAPAAPVRPDDEVFVLNVLTTWASEVESSVVALQASQNQRGTRAGGMDPPVQGPFEMSLGADVASGQVSFIAWSDILRLRGRFARMDSMKRLIAVAGWEAVRDLTSWHLVLPCIGVASHRSRRGERPLVPDVALRLKQIWEVALAANLGEPSAPLDPCYACGSSPEILVAEAGEEGRWLKPPPADTPVFTCSFCMCPVHRECADQVRDRIPSISESMPDFQQRFDRLRASSSELQLHDVLQRLHEGALCSVCTLIFPRVTSDKGDRTGDP